MHEHTYKVYHYEQTCKYAVDAQASGEFAAAAAAAAALAQPLCLVVPLTIYLFLGKAADYADDYSASTLLDLNL